MLSISNLSAKVTHDYLRPYTKDLSKPNKKILKSLIKGIIQTESVQLCEIGRFIQPNIMPKTFCEKASRFLKNLHSLISAHHNRIRKREYEYFIIDETDMQRPYAENIDGIIPVRDGSTGKIIGQGYGLIAVIGVTKEKIHVPIYFKRYEDIQPARQKAINYVLNIFGPDHGAIWLMDRGFDDKKMFDLLLNERQEFEVRICAGFTSRKLQVNDELHQVKNLTSHMKKVGYRIVNLPGRNEDLSLVFYDHHKKEPLHVLTTRSVRGNSKAKQVAKDYLKRWDIENYFRFVKQRFNLENIMLQDIQVVDSMLEIVLIASSLVMEKFVEHDYIVEFHYKIWLKKEQSTRCWASFARFLKYLFHKWKLSFRTSFFPKNPLQLNLFP